MSEVVAFLKALKHPLAKDVRKIRTLILGLDDEITESIKWNAPSFALDDDFATFHLRGKTLTLVLHSGARSKKKLKPKISDPAELLEWRGADRALATFSKSPTAAELSSLRVVLRSWLGALR